MRFGSVMRWAVGMALVFALFASGMLLVPAGGQALAGTLATQFLEILPVVILTIAFKAPLALLVWRLMLHQFDRLAGIDFRSDYREMAPSDRARYLGSRNLAAAVVVAGVFFLS